MLPNDPMEMRLAEVQEMKSRYPIGVFLAVCLVFTSLCPWWYTWREPFHTGWSTQTRMFGIDFPNWLLFVTAMTIGLVICLQMFRKWKPPVLLNTGLCFYGFIHSCVAQYDLNISGFQRTIGPILSIAGFVVLFVLDLMHQESEASPVISSIVRDSASERSSSETLKRKEGEGN
ncbi:MAG: hypothetical protein ACJ8FY_28970 [Gemmataceae bacterium]